MPKLLGFIERRFVAADYRDPDGSSWVTFHDELIMRTPTTYPALPDEQAATDAYAAMFDRGAKEAADNAAHCEARGEHNDGCDGRCVERAQRWASITRTPERPLLIRRTIQITSV